MTRRADPDEVRTWRFRLADRWQPVLHDRMSAEERRRFDGLRGDPDHWGVLRPLGDGTYRAIDRETALLLLTLRDEGPLPEYVVDAEGGTSRLEMIRSLVLDGILEVRTEDGTRVDGLHAGWGGDAADELDRIDPRSVAALRYGASLGLRDVRALAIRLYLFGGEPLTASIRRAWADRSTIGRRLGLDADGALRRRLPADWSVDPLDDDRPGWIYLRRGREGLGDGTDGPGRYKLYLAPTLDALPKVLGPLLDALGSSGARQAKLAGEAVDLVRPDKVVVYCPTFEALQALASDLAARLADADLTAADVLGVPFTADAGAPEPLRGLLAWGVDPPDGAFDARVDVGERFDTSWRAWLATRLASALVASRDLDRPWRAAVERIRLEGVDPARWTPTARLWSDVP